LEWLVLEKATVLVANCANENDHRSNNVGGNTILILATENHLEKAMFFENILRLS
jgi:hypothetical protein